MSQYIHEESPKNTILYQPHPLNWTFFNLSVIGVDVCKAVLDCHYSPIGIKLRV
ncbi:MAG: hypothetical protein LBJ00_02020 [Planctomycetaceae bacterium]|nr:hypothetical protein [Planctomycetaceae bacterium]